MFIISTLIWEKSILRESCVVLTFHRLLFPFHQTSQESQNSLSLCCSSFSSLCICFTFSLAVYQILSSLWWSCGSPITHLMDRGVFVFFNFHKLTSVAQGIQCAVGYLTYKAVAHRYQHPPQHCTDSSGKFTLSASSDILALLLHVLSCICTLVYCWFLSCTKSNDH